MNPDVFNLILGDNMSDCLPVSINTTNNHHLIMSQTMVSSFSMDISTYSNDLYEYPAMKRPDTEFPNAFIFYWENLLMPINWMRQQLGFHPSIPALQATKQQILRTPNLQAVFATIEQELIQLLTSVSNHGPVFIISDDSVQLVEATCRTFFPRLAYCLSSSTILTNVHVVGAPTTFQSASDKAASRVNLLQSLCRDQLFGHAPQRLFDPITGKFGLVVVSPHQTDIAACGDAYKIAPFVVFKALYVPNVKNLTLHEFKLHLRTLSSYISQAVPCDTSFAIQL